MTIDSIIFIIFFCVCAVLFGVGLWILWKCSLWPKWSMCRRARSWPQTEIHVKKAKVSTLHFQNIVSHRVDVLYQYKVNGQEYESSCINPFYDEIGDADGSREFRDALLRETPIYCRYNPLDHKQSLLIAKVRFYWLAKAISGVAFLIVSLILMLCVSVFCGVVGTPFVDMIKLVP